LDIAATEVTAAVTAERNGQLPLVANSPVAVLSDLLPLVANLIDELPRFEIEDEQEITAVATGWRLERNSNGYYRWRWQMKDALGNAITYVATSGKRSYRRGSQYVSIKEAEEHGHGNGE
jgi:hypothetical protein